MKNNLPFQNRVLLVADNLSDIMKKYTNELHYAVLLIGDPVVWRQRKYKVVEKGDGQEPCSIVDRAQPCIVYATAEDFENNNGTYWSDIPELENECLYEYTAKIV